MMNEIIEEEHIQNLNPPSYSTHVPIVPIQMNQSIFSVPLSQNIQPNLQNQQQTQHEQVQTYHVPIANFYQPVIAYSDVRRHYLKENFPSCFVIFHSIFMLLMALIVISIQTLLMYKDGYMSEYGAGFISGGFLLFSSLITIITVSYKSFCLIVTSVFLNLVSVLVVFGSQIVISTLVIIKSNCFEDIKKCESDVVFISNLVMISVGVISIIACLFFFISIQCGVINRASKTTNHIRSGLLNPNFLN